MSLYSQKNEISKIPPKENNLEENTFQQFSRENIVWRNVVFFIYLHVAAFYGLYLMICKAKPLTILWTYLLIFINQHGITVGSHRLWAHRAYKARFPLRCYLMLANALGFQNSIWEWSRDHRMHHKFSETNADPHNAKRGFFFAHIGWLLVRKHPDIKAKSSSIDMTDLKADPLVRFQHKYYVVLVVMMCFALPCYVAHFLWQESVWNAFFICSILRWTLFLHFTWFVNSAAHLWGDRPYDKNINPADSRFVCCISLGEGFHNYHHTFPWDYKASEWGWETNTTALWIDLWAKLGLAYDLKRVPKNIVQRRRELKGDGTTPWYDEKSFLQQETKSS